MYSAVGGVVLSAELRKIILLRSGADQSLGD